MRDVVRLLPETTARDALQEELPPDGFPETSELSAAIASSGIQPVGWHVEIESPVRTPAARAPRRHRGVAPARARDNFGVRIRFRAGGIEPLAIERGLFREAVALVWLEANSGAARERLQRIYRKIVTALADSWSRGLAASDSVVPGRLWLMIGVPALPRHRALRRLIEGRRTTPAP